MKSYPFAAEVDEHALPTAGMRAGICGDVLVRMCSKRSAQRPCSLCLIATRNLRVCDARRC